MSHTDVSAAMATRLGTLSYPIAYENADFTPPSGVYLAERLMPVETRPMGLAAESSDVLEGMWQVLCYSPAGEGKGAAFKAADAVAAAFPKALRVTHDGIEATVRRSEQNAGFVSGQRFVVPVTVYYRAAR